MKTKIQINQKEISGSLHLPGSKSISNRLLIIQALSKCNNDLFNLSNSKDTQTLQEALVNPVTQIDIGLAGTAMRFLTAFYAIQDSEIILTGSPRMQKRPISDLVDAIRFLGGDITYQNKEGFPPLKIKGKQLEGGSLMINASISSQFISAILLISPYLKKGIQLGLQGDVLSRPYIEMTLSLMSKYGIESTWLGSVISVSPGVYKNTEVKVESDWSSISYIFEIVALCSSGEVTLSYVEENSLQGDQKIMDFFKSFGVNSTIKNGLLTISKNPKFKLPTKLEFDCKATPDLAQTIAVTACGLGIQTKITGLNNLPLKETNRLVALQTELEKCGSQVKIINNEALNILPSKGILNKDLVFETYDDHRMAMCLAPLALRCNSVIIDDSEVVNKSYKSYWKDLKIMSFKVHLL
jgi:3-phosphoshikimate 1-carboxyvinyltransferase